MSGSRGWGWGWGWGWCERGIEHVFVLVGGCDIEVEELTT